MFTNLYIANDILYGLKSIVKTVFGEQNHFEIFECNKMYPPRIN